MKVPRGAEQEGIMMKRSRFILKVMAWRIVQQRRHKLVRELSAYNDRDLLDLGFSRADFPAIINGTYQR
jgi:uncharacterized protein YjiS (DUF1127 family)